MEDNMNKQNIMTSLLLQGAVNVHLNPRTEGVQVPPWFTHQDHLTLVWGYNLAIPINDLHVDEHGVSGTLSFAHTLHFCRIPWTAVFALAADGSENGYTWEEDMPVSVRAKFHQVNRPRPALRVIRGGKA